MNSVVIWDPTLEDLESPEDSVRPKEADIIQLQRDESGEYYTLYMYPDIVEEYEDFFTLREAVTSIVKKYRLDNTKYNVSAQEMFYSIERFVALGTSFMLDYRISNLDLKRGVTYKVIPPRDKSTIGFDFLR